MAMLPSEIILDEILPKLPAKSLRRFSCVSKEFKTLISSPNFILHHLRHSLSSNTNRLLITAGKGRLQFSDLDLPENPPIPLPLPYFFRPTYENCIIGCCNGLLLIGSGFNFLLINLSTGFYSDIRGTGCSYLYSPFGFGYDAVNDDYKIAVIDARHIAVLNLNDKLWHKVDNSHPDNVVASEPGCRQDAVVYDNHLCHWLIWCTLQNKHRIVCFDLLIENWTDDVLLPDYNYNYNNNDATSGDNSGTNLYLAEMLLKELRDKQKKVTALHVLDGFLSVLTQSNGYDVWVMKEYGIKESWVKLFGFSDTRCTPLAFGRGSKSKVLCNNGWRKINQFNWYNIGEKRYYDAKIYEIYGAERLYEVCVVNGSLVNVPNGIRIQSGQQRW